MMFYSKKTEYAVQAMIVLGDRFETGDYISLEEIMKSAELPKALTFKLLSILVKDKLLVSTLGPKGGFRLSKPANKIKLFSIISHFEPKDQYEQCALGFPFCSEHNKCSLHDQWKGLRKPIVDYLETTTLDELVKTFRENGPRKKIG